MTRCCLCTPTGRASSGQGEEAAGSGDDGQPAEYAGDGHPPATAGQGDGNHAERARRIFTASSVTAAGSQTEARGEYLWAAEVSKVMGLTLDSPGSHTTLAQPIRL